MSDARDPAGRVNKLTDERLADIRRFVDFGQYGRGDGRDDALVELLAEVERLRAALAADRDAMQREIDALRRESAAWSAKYDTLYGPALEIVRAVADAGVVTNDGFGTTSLLLCPGDDAENIRDKARAALAAIEADKPGTEIGQ